MKPLVKLNSIAFAVATSIVFMLWQMLLNTQGTNPILIALVGVVVSLGLYRIIANFIILLIQQSTWVKKKFLGSQFMEGTWVGFYIGPSGSQRYLIERFEQEIDSLVIRGKSFDEKFAYHSTWTSSSVNIDVQNGRITYMYELIPIKEIKNNNGICVFNFERDDQYTKPKGLEGFSADIHMGVKVKAKEIKVSDYCNLSEKEALQKAVEMYDEFKDNF